MQAQMTQATVLGDPISQLQHHPTTDDRDQEISCKPAGLCHLWICSTTEATCRLPIYLTWEVAPTVAFDVVLTAVSLPLGIV
jgi:hypothetical protein